MERDVTKSSDHIAKQIDQCYVGNFFVLIETVRDAVTSNECVKEETTIMYML